MSSVPDTSATARPASETLFRVFRIVAFVEGVTTLVLFFVAMPIKYGLGDPSGVKLWGPIHGYAFLAYLVLMAVALRGRGWGRSGWLRTTLASFYPFGTFLNDRFLVRRWTDTR